MRILFKPGKQKELIKKFKKEKNLTMKRLSLSLKIKQGKLKAYFDETSLIPDKIYNKLDRKKEFEKFIKEKRKENWGKIKGGKNSSGRTKAIKFPKESEKLAEFYGIMLGDGNSHKSKSYKIGTYMIRIVGDSRLDKQYLTSYVKPLIENLFKIQIRVGKFKDQNAMFIEAHSKRLIEFLEQKGFKPGNKIKNKLNIPPWIKKNKRYLINCLRGLYDTDGSFYKITNQNSHQICFTNKNKKLLNDVREGLLSLEIRCSKISNKDIYITKKSELQKFLKLVNFNNSRHLNKVKMFNIAP